MENLRGHRISVPAYCYPRYDYLSDRADTLRKYFEGIEGSANFRRYLDQGEEKLGSIIRNGMAVKSKLTLFVLNEKDDSDFLETNQFLVKDVEKEDKPKPVAVSWKEVLELTMSTKVVDLSTAFIVVLSGDRSEVLKKVDDPDIFKALPQHHTYFVSKDTKECCKMEDMFNEKPWTRNLGNLVESALEKSVIDVVKQMEQFMTELLPGKRAPIQGNIMNFLRKRLEDWLGNEETKRDFFSITQSQGLEGTSKTLEGELTTIFRQKMKDSLSREAKSCVLDFVAQYHGLNPSLTNHFLQNKLDFEDALKKAITTMLMPSYSDLKMSYKNVVKMVTRDYITAIIPLINSVESLVTNLVVILERMRRLQFVTHALLRLSPLTCMEIKVPPPLPKGLQQDLLKKPLVTGCGTIYGELVIHVKSAISEQQKEDIEGCLSLYGFLCPYTIEVFNPKCTRTAGPSVMQGADVRAEKECYELIDAKFVHGSLGCFVDVKYQNRDEKEVHFITCHHCFEGCNDDVSVMRYDMRYEDFGLKKHFHMKADIALVQVKKTDFISKGLQHVNGIREIDRWQFYQDVEYSAGRQVYKVGSTSGITRGHIVSDNYLLNPNIPADDLPPDSFLIAPSSALNVPSTSRIEAEMQGAGASHVQRRFFSNDGDSGSVVCDIDPKSGDVLVLGLLHGKLYGKNNPDQSIFSYASKMRCALIKLQEKYSEIESIEPSQDKIPDLPGAAAY